MTVVGQLGEGRLIQGRLRVGPRGSDFSVWERNFPVSLQDSQPDGESVFRVEFTLNEEERRQFKKEIKSSLNENLPVEIRLGKRDPAFKVIKQGPRSEALNSKAPQIASFIGRRVEFTYIPAVRTANAALEVVRDMVDRELRLLERNATYTELVEKLAEAQKPVLQAISERIGNALKDFIPQIESVDVRATEDLRYRALRRAVEIIVNDGTPTSLERKGDGVQSLVAISLLRGTTAPGRDIILALEEPESHLHPSAIHRLREVIDELSHQHQIVITTHCPLFVDRARIGSNIIVSGSKARQAKSTAEIRSILGVRASDNLIHASWVLVVEGDNDARSLRAVLSAESLTLRAALRNAHLVIDHLHGSSKLSYKLSELRNCLCGVHVFLDYDDSGRAAASNALDEGLLKEVDIHHSTCPSKKNSEWEDLVATELYETAVHHKYGVALRGPAFQNAKRWSERMSDTFQANGKVWNEKVRAEVKAMVANLVEENPGSAINPKIRGALDALRSALETKIGLKGEADLAGTSQQPPYVKHYVEAS
jgi:5S rRNA maturation endonuclease (ribonuclease M5)